MHTASIEITELRNESLFEVNCDVRRSRTELNL